MNKLKIGILTYHSEMNYGCTLQAFAMQEAYKELGQDPIIIDRYITPDNRLLLGHLTDTGLKTRLISLFMCFSVSAEHPISCGYSRRCVSIKNICTQRITLSTTGRMRRLILGWI